MYSGTLSEVRSALPTCHHKWHLFILTHEHSDPLCSCLWQCISSCHSVSHVEGAPCHGSMSPYSWHEAGFAMDCKLKRMPVSACGRGMLWYLCVSCDVNSSLHLGILSNIPCQQSSLLLQGLFHITIPSEGTCQPFVIKLSVTLPFAHNLR